MFALKRNAVIGFNLCCGSGGGPAMAPASPGGNAAPPPPAAAPAAELPQALIGSPGVCTAAARPEVPRSLIGCSAAPRSLIGCGAAPRSLIGCGAARWSPEEELDGYEPDPERGPAGDSLPGTPPGPPDGLRQDSLELISRYLREAAGEAEPGVKKKLFPGLLGGPGRPGGAVMEKALETLRRLGDGVLQKHQLAFQGALAAGASPAGRAGPGREGRGPGPPSPPRGAVPGPGSVPSQSGVSYSPCSCSFPCFGSEL